MDVRKEIHRLIDLVPDAPPLEMIEDLQERLWLLARVAKAEADIEAGRGLTLEQVSEALGDGLKSKATA